MPWERYLDATPEEEDELRRAGVTEIIRSEKPKIEKPDLVASDMPSAVPGVKAPTRRNRDQNINQLVDKYSKQHELDPSLINSIIEVESAFNPLAVSPKGARGLMQLMPQTAQDMGVSDSFNAEENIKGGTQYFRQLLDKFNGDVALSLAAYNAGSTRVEEAGRIPNIEETQNYVQSVMRKYQGEDYLPTFTRETSPSAIRDMIPAFRRIRSGQGPMDQMGFYTGEAIPVAGAGKESALPRGAQFLGIETPKYGLRKEEIPYQKAPQKPESRSLIRDLISAVPRAAVRAAEGYADQLGAAAELTSLFSDKTAQLLHDKSIEYKNQIEAARERTPWLRPSKEEEERFVRRGVISGIENVGQSVSSAVPWAAAGAAIGAGIGALGFGAGAIPGAWLGAKLGFIFGGGLSFGLAEYNNSLQESLEKGMPLDEARKLAAKRGSVEWIGETAGNWGIGRAFRLFKPIGYAIAKPGEVMLKDAFKRPLRQQAFDLLAGYGTEVGTEMGQEFFEALFAAQAGLAAGTDEQGRPIAYDPWYAAAEAIIPAITMTTLMGGGHSAMQRMNRKRHFANLQDPKAKAGDRFDAVAAITSDLVSSDRSNEEIADIWATAAIGRIARGEAISIDESILDMPAADLGAMVEQLKGHVSKERQKEISQFADQRMKQLRRKEQDFQKQGKELAPQEQAELTWLHGARGNTRILAKVYSGQQAFAQPGGSVDLTGKATPATRESAVPEAERQIAGTPEGGPEGGVITPNRDLTAGEPGETRDPLWDQASQIMNTTKDQSPGGLQKALQKQLNIKPDRAKNLATAYSTMISNLRAAPAVPVARPEGALVEKPAPIKPVPAAVDLTGKAAPEALPAAPQPRAEAIAKQPSLRPMPTQERPVLALEQEKAPTVERLRRQIELRQKELDEVESQEMGKDTKERVKAAMQNEINVLQSQLTQLEGEKPGREEEYAGRIGKKIEGEGREAEELERGEKGRIRLRDIEKDRLEAREREAGRAPGETVIQPGEIKGKGEIEEDVKPVETVAGTLLTGVTKGQKELRNEISNVRYGPEGEIHFEFKGETYRTPEPTDVMPVGQGDASKSWALKQILNKTAQKIIPPAKTGAEAAAPAEAPAKKEEIPQWRQDLVERLRKVKEGERPEEKPIKAPLKPIEVKAAKQEKANAIADDIRKRLQDKGIDLAIEFEDRGDVLSKTKYSANDLINFKLLKEIEEGKYAFTESVTKITTPAERPAKPAEVKPEEVLPEEKPKPLAVTEGDRVKTPKGNGTLLSIKKNEETGELEFKVRIKNQYHIFKREQLQEMPKRGGFKVNPKKSLVNAFQYVGGVNPENMRESGLWGEWMAIAPKIRIKISRRSQRLKWEEVVDEVRDIGYEIDHSNWTAQLSGIEATRGIEEPATEGTEAELAQAEAEIHRLNGEIEQLKTRADQGLEPVETYAEKTAQMEVDRRAAFAKSAIDRVITGKGTWAQKRQQLDLPTSTRYGQKRYDDIPIDEKEARKLLEREMADTVQQTGIMPTELQTALQTDIAWERDWEEETGDFDIATVGNFTAKIWADKEGNGHNSILNLNSGQYESGGTFDSYRDAKIDAEETLRNLNAPGTRNLFVREIGYQYERSRGGFINPGGEITLLPLGQTHYTAGMNRKGISFRKYGERIATEIIGKPDDASMNQLRDIAGESENFSFDLRNAAGELIGSGETWRGFINQLRRLGDNLNSDVVMDPEAQYSLPFDDRKALSLTLQVKDKPVTVAGKKSQIERSDTGVSLLGLSITPKIQNGEWIETRGMQARTVEDLVAIGRLFRNPQYEFFHVVFIKDGKVAGHNAVTTRLPGIADTRMEKTMGRSVYRVNARADRLQADVIAFIHNHPSGDVKISKEDLKATENWAKNVPKLAAHIIVNHETYSTITRDGQTDEYKKLPNETPDLIHEASVPFEGLGKPLINSQDLASWGKTYTLPSPDSVTVLYRSRSIVRAVENVPMALFNNEREFRNWTRGKARQYGGMDLFVYYSNPQSDEMEFQVKKKMADYVNKDILMDAITEKLPVTLRTMLPGQKMALFGLTAKQVHKATRAVREEAGEYRAGTSQFIGDMLLARNRPHPTTANNEVINAFDLGIERTGEVDMNTKAGEIVKKIRGDKFMSKFLSDVPNDDLRVWEELLSLPWYIAKRHPEFRRFIDTELNRQEERSEMNIEMTRSPNKIRAGEIHEILNLPKKEAEKVGAAIVDSDADQELMSNTKLKNDYHLNKKEQSAYYAWWRSMKNAWKGKLAYTEASLYWPYMTRSWMKPYDAWQPYQEFKTNKKGEVIKDKYGAPQIVTYDQGVLSRLRKSDLQLVVEGMMDIDEAIQRIPDQGSEESNQKAEKQFRKAIEDLQAPAKKIQDYRKEWNKVKFYFPRVREQGDYVVRVWEGEGEERKAVHSERVYNRLQSKRVVNRLLKEGYSRSQIQEKYSPPLPETMYGDLEEAAMERFIKNVIANMEAGQEMTGEQAEMIREGLFKHIAEELNKRGFGVHAVRRKEHLITGYKTKDVQKIFKDYMSGLSGFLTKRKAAYEFHRSLNQMGQQLREERKKEKGLETPKLFEYARTYSRDMLWNTERMDLIAGKMRALAFMYYLAGNIKSATVNATQNYAVAIPELAKYTRSYAKAFATYHKAIRDVINETSMKKRLNANEYAALHEAINKGVTTDQYIREITGRGEGLGDKFDKFNYTVALPFRWVEIKNRQSAFVAAYRTFIKQGMNHQQAADRAKDYVYDCHYLYGKANLAPWARGPSATAKLLRVSYTFRSYTHMFLHGMMDNIRGLPGGQKHLAAVGQALAALVVLGGVGSWPWLDDLLDYLERFSGSPLRSKMYAWLQSKGGDILRTFGEAGLPGAVFGVDLSGSLRIGAPKLTIRGTEEAVYGVYGGMIDKGTKAVEALQAHDPIRAIEHAMPSFVSNLMKAKREYEKGMTSTSGKVKFDEQGKPIFPTLAETAARTLGFRQVREARATQEQRTFSNMRVKFEKDRDRLRSRYVAAETREEKRAVIKEVQKYNREVMKYRGVIPKISSQSLQQAKKQHPTMPYRRYQRLVQHPAP